MTDKPKTKEELACEAATRRFEELGPEQVKSMHATGSFPSEWNLFVHNWLAAKDKPKDK